MTDKEALEASDYVLYKLIAALCSDQMWEAAKIANEHLLANGIILNVSLEICFGGSFPRGTSIIRHIDVHGTQDYESGAPAHFMLTKPKFRDTEEEDNGDPSQL